MVRISSRSTFFSKKVLPFVWFGFLALFMVGALASGSFRKDPIIPVIPCALAILGFFVMRKLVWDLVDEVYDCGDFLVIKNRGEEESVALSNIMNVSASPNMNPPRITLRLVERGKFGTEIAFSPVHGMTLNPFARNKVAEDLIVRVDRARSKRVV